MATATPTTPATTPAPAAPAPEAKGKAKLDWAATHDFTYAGPAAQFRVTEDADPVGPGGKVSLTGKQVRALARSGNRFKAASQVGQDILDAVGAAAQAERARLEAEAAAKKAAGQ